MYLEVVLKTFTKKMFQFKSDEILYDFLNTMKNMEKCGVEMKLL
jgi:hypothetical protein